MILIISPNFDLSMTRLITQRRQWDVQTKVQIVNLVRCGLSIKEASRTYDVPRSCIREWRKKLPQLLDACEKKKKKKKTVHKGPKPVFEHIDSQIMDYLRDLRAQEMPVKDCDLIAKAASLDRDFRSMERPAQMSYISRMKRRHNVVLRRSTHQGQKRMDEIL
jgi:transposase-like protein